jgi:hypothetical protein
MPPPLANFRPEAVVASIGTVRPGDLDNAQLLLADVPTALRDAAHSASAAPLLLYGLLLDDAPDIRSRQRSLVASRAGADALQSLDSLDRALRRLGPEHKLPLLQLTLPALKSLPASELDAFLGLLDELVHFDDRISAFEFALQKLLIRTLALNRRPAAGVAEVYSFQALATETCVVLSALAHASSADAAAAASAFNRGAAHLKLIEARLALLPANASQLVHLDVALDVLATASGPIKQRLLVAAGHVVSADDQILAAEAELLRAVAAALDCPMPPLGAPVTAARP